MKYANLFHTGLWCPTVCATPYAKAIIVNTLLCSKLIQKINYQC